MRVCLVRPKGFHDREDTWDVACEPIGLGYLASALRHAGHEAHIVDGLTSWIGERELVGRVAQTGSRLIGITVTCQDYLRLVLELAAALRSALPHATIALGGHAPSHLAAEILEYSADVDYIVVGEGERAIVRLAHALETGTSLTTIPGVHGRAGATSSLADPIRDLDELPWPARDGLASILQKGVPAATVITSRGCTRCCRFCSVCSFYGVSAPARWRPRRVSEVVRELVMLRECHGIRYFQFKDDNFLGGCEQGVSRARSLAKALLARLPGITFEIACRPDEVKPQLFSLLKRAGLRKVFLGAESGADSCLRRWAKHLAVASSRRAIQTLRDLDIECLLGFIMLDADSTLDELEENIRFLRESASTCSIEPLWGRLQLYAGCHDVTLRDILAGNRPAFRSADVDAVADLVDEHIGPMVAASSHKRYRLEFALQARLTEDERDGIKLKLGHERRWGDLFLDLLEETIRLRRGSRSEWEWAAVVRDFPVTVRRRSAELVCLT
ncbi:MAG: radical SAM protein [Planctomycetota bacterium]